MSREKRSPKGAYRKVQEWGIIVRLNDGHILYYYPDERGRGDEWGKSWQAKRFASREEAQRLADGMATNSKAWEYRVVALTSTKSRGTAAD